MFDADEARAAALEGELSFDDLLNGVGGANLLQVDSYETCLQKIDALKRTGAKNARSKWCLQLHMGTGCDTL
jgi:hypothetical protein